MATLWQQQDGGYALLFYIFNSTVIDWTCFIIIIIIIIIIIGIQPLGRSGQRPELSQATGMALVRCILSCNRP